ncbi:MAG: prolyl-tRNA synthetase [Candidatus Argoarchaeum ethanivorans]|uniref:Proline--tRNA ligase n=1 Tax=Candidatus Argoarchaeum ethanivorans TaxID=2608793 RepID=A0A8B3S1G4_9EURY|nr:MAG: prolyl-tRNA synthetase [Candidatus Argoarchaeum ethanivorans]
MFYNSLGYSGGAVRDNDNPRAKLPLKEELSKWYNELLWMAEVIDVRYPVKGLCAWYPFGFSLKSNVYNILRELLNVDHSEALFPLLIPKSEFMKEAEHIKGFEDEVYWVTHGGTEPLEVPLALRPTSETAIYPMYRLWVRSHTDLPLLIYQIVNTFRYETKHTRPLIRLREITSFKEAHTVHASWDEASLQVEAATKMYQQFYHRLAVPTIVSKRPEWDKFPGADYTMAVDTLMPDGRTLQIGTAHHLGTNFAKTFEITYEDVDGSKQYVNQTCYGISERCIAALISLHGDNHGLVLPPEVAPVQVVIVPIIFGEGKEVLVACKQVETELKASGIRVKLDNSDERPGAKYYKWELKGVPIRIEIGPKDLQKNSCMVVRRDTMQKQSTPLLKLNPVVEDLFKKIHQHLLESAKKHLDKSIIDCKTLEEVAGKLSLGIVRISWCGEQPCGLEIEEATGANILGVPVGNLGKMAGVCPVCGKSTMLKVLIAKTY